MKFLVPTQLFGDRVCVNPDWRQMMFFEGRQPPSSRLLTLEMEGLEQLEAPAIIEWLKRRRPDVGENTRRDIVELPEDIWRLATLDDFIDACNYETAVWHAGQQFEPHAFDPFLETWMPKARKRVTEALALTDEDERLAQLDDATDFARRICFLAYQFPLATSTERQAQLRTRDQRLLEQLSGQSTIDAWLAIGIRLEDFFVIDQFLMAFVDRVLDETRESTKIIDFVQRLERHPRLRDHVARDRRFWEALRPYIELEPTVSGETIDVSNAIEYVVELNFDIFRARRVGSIVPGRRALFVSPEDSGKPLTLVRGDRKLKMKVMESGGRLDRFGNTLTVEDQRSIRPLLLRVEEIDTLANVAPQRALSLIANEGFEPDHPVFEAARAADGDHRHARVLADLLIEYIVGVDADVARRLARQQRR